MGRLFVYCGVPSQGAYELVKALEASRLRKFDGMDLYARGNKRLKLNPGDQIVCWGKPIPPLDGIKVLNSGSYQTKFDDHTTMMDYGVRVVMISKNKGSGYSLGRTFHHQGGKDLLTPPLKPDFYAYKYNFSKEYRIHSFDGRSIRAGEKVLREGWVVGSEEEFRNNLIKGEGKLIAHPWIRSYDAGWKIQYDGFHSTPKLKKLANSAVKSLGLTFGAVDIGERTEDSLYYVIEVNRAPGIEGNSIASYVRAIQRWLKEGVEAEVKTEDLRKKPNFVLEEPAVAPRVRMAPPANAPRVANYRAAGIRLDQIVPNDRIVVPAAPPAPNDRIVANDPQWRVIIDAARQRDAALRLERMRAEDQAIVDRVFNEVNNNEDR